MSRDLLAALDVLPGPAAVMVEVRDAAGQRGFETVRSNEPARHLGVSSNVLGDPLLGLLSADDRERLCHALGRTLDEGVSTEAHVTLRRLIPGHEAPTGTSVVVRCQRVGAHVLVTLAMDGTESGAVARAEVQEARSHARRLEVLQRVTAALMSVDTLEDAATIILDELFRAKPLVAGVVAVLEDDREWLRLAATRGVRDDVITSVGRMRLSREDLPVTVVARTGTPEWRSSRAELLTAYPTVGESLASATQAMAVLPLETERGSVGALGLSFAEETRFDRDLQAFLLTLARQCARAVERTLLREESQRRSHHLAALSEASGLFATHALDVTTLAQAVARSASEAIGGPCVLWLLDDDGTQLETVALEGASPEEQAAIWRVVEEHPLHVGEGVTGGAVASGTPKILPLREDSALPPSLPPAYAALLKRHVGGDLLAVPLRAHGQALGALSLLRGPCAHSSRDDLSLLVDLGERAALALYTARLYDEAQGAVRVRDDFLSIAGHELRTPLTALHLQLQALVRYPDRASTPALVQERARRMSQQTDRLARLITELLDVSRIVRGRLVLEPDELDLVEVLRGVLEICDADLRRASCELVLDAPASLVGRWDRTRVEQLLQNLLLNACKYGRGQPVEVSVREEGSGAAIVVRDRGIGIPPEDQARIFERFERAVPSRHFGGLGLGLWITRQVVEAHGGAISVESKPGEGAVFRVSLPSVRGGS